MPLTIFRRNFSLRGGVSGDWSSFLYDIVAGPLDIVLGWRAVHNLDIGDSGRGHCFESLVICPFVREDGLPSIKIA